MRLRVGCLEYMELRWRPRLRFQFVLPWMATFLAMPTEHPREKLLPCASYGHGMKLVTIIPKLGGLPELATFQFPNCEEVTTIENE